jgi:hypothetical protein
MWRHAGERRVSGWVGSASLKSRYPSLITDPTRRRETTFLPLRLDDQTIMAW